MRGRIRIAIACAGLLALPVAGARAQATFRETGSVTVGGYIVWVRGTSSNAVELFVGRGFRDAFAQAHEMDAAKLQQWIDSVRAIKPMPADDSSADARVRGSVVSADVTMLRRVGGSFSGLRLMVNGEEPITMAEPTARDFIAALDSATHAARELSPATTRVATAVTLTTVAQAAVAVDSQTTSRVAIAPAPVPTPVVAPAPPPPAPPPPPPPPPTPTPPPAPPVVAVTASVSPSVASPLIGVPPPSPDSSPSAPIGRSVAEAPPELVLPAPREPVLLLASRVEIMPLPLPEPAVPPVVVRRPVILPPDAPPPAVVPAPVATPSVASTPVVVAPPPPAPDTLIPPHPAPPADKLIHTPLGPFTIPGALLADRDKEAQYCYTQLGLKYNPDLKGEITVKLSLGSDGAVSDAIVTKRSWQGISAGEVEACVRALAHDWTFASSDPAIADGAKVLTFSFAPPAPAP